MRKQHRCNPAARLAPCLVLAALTILVMSARAQHERFDELAEQGESALTVGNYERAIQCFEEIVTKGQTYVAFFEVRFDLGWAYYLTGRYEDAIPIFKDLSGPRSPSEDMREQAHFLLAECHARFAGEMPDDDPSVAKERKKNLDTAIKLHTEFQTKYSASQNIAESLYGRAYAHYLSGDFQKAEDDLQTVITKHRSSPTVTDARYLLASVYAKQGLLLFKADKKDEGEAKLQEARKMFESLTSVEKEHTANDAAFAMAETWFSAEMYPEAIRYFHKVQPKKTVLNSLKRKDEAIQERIGALLRERADATAEKRQLNTIRSRYNMISDSPDLMVSSYFRIADAYHRLGKYDESRIVSRHLANLMEGDQKKQALLLIINSYIRQSKPDEACDEVKNFVMELGPDHSELKPLALGVGQLFMLNNEVDKANEMFDLAMSIKSDDKDSGQTEEDAYYMKATGMYYDNRFEDAIGVLDEYLEKYPEGIYIPNALYFKAVSFAGLKDWEQAIVYIDELLEKYPEGSENFDSIEEANYQKGWILVESENYEPAVEHFRQYLDKTEDGSLRPEMMYQLGIALQELEKYDEAAEVLKTLAKDHPENQVAPYGLYQIAVADFKNQNFEKMAESLKELVTNFPDNPIVTDAYYFLGFGAQRERNFDDAVKYFRQSLESDPMNERAPQCMLDIATALKDKAGAMGRPSVLAPDLQKTHKETMLEAAKTYETLLEQYPASDQSLQAVTGIAKVIADMTDAGQFTLEEAEQYYKDALARYADNSELQAQLEFSLGVFKMNVNMQEQALASFKKAMVTDPNVRLSAELLVNYAKALMESGALDEALEVCDKIMIDYEDDERALAPATFLIAEINFRKKNFTEAKALFEEVLETYPWFEEGQHGRVKLAEIYEVNGDLQRAEEMFTEVFSQTKGEPRVAALLAVGRCQVKQAQIATKGSAQYIDKLKAANGNLTKLIVMFEAFDQYVSEGLYWAGIVYELNDDFQNAANSFGKLAKKYPQSPWASKAKEHLAKIGQKGIVPQENAPMAPAIE